MSVAFKRLDPRAIVPSYKSDGAAGMDLHACITDELIIGAGGTELVETGIALAVPDGWEAQVRSRSGLASVGVVVANSPGTIDSDYRGEVRVILHNQSGDAVRVRYGDRIAQLVFARAPRVELIEVDELSPTARGAGGFGSTGA